uniref:Uncharacterized protein n=1 Tax=Brassica oleracea TaxID=3712 RepID=A0A3P6F6F7_BRAOL|nr:unnamed protein product [Brassica oleracea]
MSTRRNKEIGLLLVEPLDLERVIHKSKRAVDTLQAAIDSVEIQASIDTIHPGTVHRGTVPFDTIHLMSNDTVHSPSIDTVHSPSIDTVHSLSIDTVHHDTVHHDTVHPGTVHSNTVHPDTFHPLLDDIMAKRDEQHVSGELSRAEEAGTEDATSTSTDDMTSTSTDITTSTSIDITTSIDDVDREVTMEDSLELEEWLEDMDQNLKRKLDDDHHTSRGDLGTSKASIGQHQPDEIDRQPPHIIDLHPPDIDRHRQPIIDRHHPPNIDRCPLLDVLPCCIIEMEPIEERMYMSKASHLAVPKHQRPPFWTEEAVGFHKRVKRIHDPMKIVVPCAVFEAESPIPPDRSMQYSSYIGLLDDPLHAETSQRGLRFRDEVDKGPAETASINTNWIPSNDINKSASIDATTSPSTLDAY